MSSKVSKGGPREYLGYVRVSQVRDRDSDQNKARYHSPDMQLDSIQEVVKRVEGTYVDFRSDPDKSGYQKNVVREGWDECVAWVMEDPAHRGIVAYDTSRLARNLHKLLGDVQHTIVPAGGRIIVAEGIDTAVYNWEMQLQVFGMMAEQYSRKIGENWDRVHQRRIVKKQSPVGKVPYGYRRVDGFDPDTGASLGIEPDPGTSEVMRRSYRLYLDGMGLRQICQTLNGDGVPAPRGGLWSTTSLSRIMRNPACVGRFVFKGVETEGGWDPIVDDDTWEAFSKMQAGKAKVPNRQKSLRWYLAGIARCGYCGGPLTVNYLPQPVVEGVDDKVILPMPAVLAKRAKQADGLWTLAAQKEHHNTTSTAMCSTYRGKGKQACKGVFMRRAALERQFTFFLASVLEQVATATVGKAGEAREAARTDAARQAADARAELELVAEARVDLAEQKSLRQIDEATHRATLRRLDARADDARERLEAAEATADAADPLTDVYAQLEEGGAGMTPQAWNLVLKRVIQKVEVRDDTLLFVPTLGKPVEWKRQNLPRGRDKRRATIAAQTTS